jgi:crotonobetainyl-CoA:carnitine CoA-transferase CaiB-like acyl-CoA transferase
LEERFLVREPAEWIKILRDAGVAVEVVRVEPAEDLLQDPQAVRDGAVADFPHPVYGRLRVVGNLMRLSNASAAPNQLPPPLVGQHTGAILAELGYSSSAAAALERAGVVAQAPG